VAERTRFDVLLNEADSLPSIGWDFSRLGDRITITPPPWDFGEIVAAHAQTSPDLLDIGTGGGEWLAALPVRAERTVATESWPPNLDVAGQRLRPLRITVVETEAARDNVDQGRDETRGRLPFPSGSFALVVSRHESFLPTEVARVLCPNGTFVTQQVGGDYGDFYDALELPRPRAPTRRWDVRLAAQQLQRVGLDVVDSREGTETASFADAGALAWYLKTVPWTIENFSIATHRRALERAHDRIVREGGLDARLPAFWLKAVKRSPHGSLP
jgi:hypothetical protein